MAINFANFEKKDLIVQWNPALQSPRYYGHLFWPPGKNDHTYFCNETLVNTVTSLLWPNFFGPLLTVLSGFHCPAFSRDQTT